jgi:hypothetical protein
MQETIQALLALQELDASIFALKRELRRLPEERAARRAQIDALIGRRDESKKKAQELRVKIKELEDMSTISRQRIRKTENELATARSDMALQAAYQHQIKSLKKDISIAEEEGLTHLTEVETHDAEVTRLDGEIAAAEKVFAEFAANVERESKVAREKLAALEKERATRLSPDIHAESFTLYEKLVASREGVALARLEERICQACYIQVPVNLYVRVARGTALVQCPSCDRIFYTDA